jgi:hypothetical protein
MDGDKLQVCLRLGCVDREKSQVVSRFDIHYSVAGQDQSIFF